jgi:hypothetical protein
MRPRKLAEIVDRPLENSTRLYSFFPSGVPILPQIPAGECFRAVRELSSAANDVALKQSPDIDNCADLLSLIRFRIANPTRISELLISLSCQTAPTASRISFRENRGIDLPAECQSSRLRHLPRAIRRRRREIDSRAFLRGRSIPDRRNISHGSPSIRERPPARLKNSADGAIDKHASATTRLPMAGRAL